MCEDASISFSAVRDCLECLSPDARVSADVLIMQNIPCCKGCHYVFFIVDHATKMCWVLLLKTGESKHILAHFASFVNKVLQSLNIQQGSSIQTVVRSLLRQRCLGSIISLVRLPLSYIAIPRR